jgi:hypothetical protein
MLIMALDIATYCGFAIGRAGQIPASGTVRLKKLGDPAHVAAFNMRCFLRDRVALERPDLVVIEDYLNPNFQKGAAAVVLSIGCHFVARAECMARSIRCETVAPASVRKHFCGAANAGERSATKRMVVQRARALGYVPKDCTDDNRCDAVALWDYAVAHFARATPRELVMFREERQ